MHLIFPFSIYPSYHFILNYRNMWTKMNARNCLNFFSFLFLNLLPGQLICKNAVFVLCISQNDAHTTCSCLSEESQREKERNNGKGPFINPGDFSCFVLTENIFPFCFAPKREMNKTILQTDEWKHCETIPNKWTRDNQGY